MSWENHRLRDAASRDALSSGQIIRDREPFGWSFFESSAFFNSTKLDGEGTVEEILNSLDDATRRRG